MTLPLKDLENKQVMIISEEHIDAFSEEALVGIVNSIASDDVTPHDIEENLVSDILDCANEIDVLKEIFFTCEPEQGSFLWRVISEKDVVILESYIMDSENETMELNSTCELVLKEDENVCEVKFEIDKEIEEFVSEDSTIEEVIASVRISMLLRLTFYMFTIHELG